MNDGTLSTTPKAGALRTPAGDPSWTPGKRPIWVDDAELAQLDWHNFFGNQQPVEIEIGCGKAGFLLRRATARVDRNFLGIEWANEFYRYAADRMRRHQVPNVRILRTDASTFIRNQCPRDSLACLHVYHPDPWPKKRHHKRRLFQPAFAAAAAQCLKPGARLAVQTDHCEYFEQISSVLRAEPALVETAFLDPEWLEGLEGEAEHDVGSDGKSNAVTDEKVSARQYRLATNFENKYRREGRSIYQIAFRKREEVQPGHSK
ncbi:MAG: tRNA (guanosine(46)-N7)-methyltransferase TrmB [Phycisphaerae bacterium]